MPLMESPPGRMGEVITSHRNAEHELATIERCLKPPFEGQLLLCLYDDSSPTVAPMLLDVGTVRWLVGALNDATAETQR